MALLNRLTLQEKARFFQQLAALLNSGMTVPQSLNLAGRDCHLTFGRYLKTVSRAIDNGQDLADAMNLNSGYFDGWTISLIRLAEYSGSLAQTCSQLAIAFIAQAKRHRLYGSIRLSAIAIVWSLLILTAVIFNRTPMGFIKPEFWLRSLAIAFLLVLISFLTSRYLSRGSFWVRSLPIVGRIIQSRSLIYLGQLQLPLSCGTPMLAAVELVREHIPDMVMRQNLSSAARKIRAGETLSSSLEGKLPPIATQMILTGEETGNLDMALHNVSQYYEGDLERRLGLIESSLRLLMILAIGSLIAAVGIRGMRLLFNLLPN